jgi:hypothetical protein
MARLLTRRNFLCGLGGTALAASAGAADVRWFEPQALQLHRLTVPLARPGSGEPTVRIVHLSDLHASSVVPFGFIAEAIDLALAQKPDVIAVTGDFVTSTMVEPARYADILRRLPAAAPTFACLGNHDGGPWTKRAGGLATTDEVSGLLRAAGITHLENSGCSMTIRGRELQLIGVGDLWCGMCDPNTAFTRTPPRKGAARVLLNHNPDAKQLLRPFDWDIVLCGHTHGGQLRLPFIGTPFAPVKDKRYVEGLHRWEERWLYITHGVGNLHGVRFNCRPQVSVLDLT